MVKNCGCRPALEPHALVRRYYHALLLKKSQAPSEARSRTAKVQLSSFSRFFASSWLIMNSERFPRELSFSPCGYRCTHLQERAWQRRSSGSVSSVSKFAPLLPRTTASRRQ